MQRLRPAGFNERRCIARDRLSLYGTIITVGTYTKSSADPKPISKDEICRIINQAISRHLALSVVLQDSATEKPFLARLYPVDLGNHVHFLDDIPNTRDLLERIHNTPVTGYEERPQWDVYISNWSEAGFTMAFASSHAIMDGRSGYIFHKTILKYLEGDAPDEDDDAVNAYMPLEKRGDLSVSWGFLLGPLVREYAPSWIGRMLGLQAESAGEEIVWTGATSRPEKVEGELPTTAVHAVEFPQGKLKALLSRCRAHDVRLTGLLINFAAQALARALREQGVNGTTFRIGTAIDLRRCLPGSDSDTANYVSSADETVTVDPTSPIDLAEQDWEAMRSSTEKLQNASSTLADQPVGLLKYLSNYREWTTRKAQAPAKGSFEISNLGVFDGKSSSWKMVRMTFSQSADGTGSPFNLNVASTTDGPLSIVLSWWPRMLGVEDERKLAKDVCEGIVEQMLAVSGEEA